MGVLNKVLCGCVVAWMSTANAVTPVSLSFSESASPFSLEYDGKDGFSATLSRHYYSTRHHALSQYNSTAITKLSFDKTVGGATVHYYRSQSDQEQHQFFGLSRGNATVVLFGGSGDSFSKRDNALFPDLNPYFAHGGTRSAFDFNGAGVQYGFSEGLSTQLVGAHITAPDVDARDAFYAGVSGDWLSAGYVHVERAHESAGSGLRLSLARKDFGFGFHQIRTATDAQVRHVGFTWKPSSRSSFSVSYEDTRNPLYRDGDDHYVMLRFQRAIGTSSIPLNLKASGEKKYGLGTMIGVGAGVAGVALAVSSGLDSSDGALRLTAEDNAGIDALSAINPTSVAENLEYGGWVYRNADNTFSFTSPVRGTIDSVNIGDPATTVPADTTAVASYHTHAGPDPRFLNNVFSLQDIAADQFFGVNGFLGTPQSCATESNDSGCAKKHVVATGEIITLGEIPN